MSINLEALSNEDKRKLQNLIAEGKKILLELDDLKAAYKDLVKTVAEDLNIKPTVLGKAVRAAYKGDLNQKQEEIDSVSELLEFTGLK